MGEEEEESEDFSHAWRTRTFPASLSSPPPPPPSHIIRRRRGSSSRSQAALDICHANNEALNHVASRLDGRSGGGGGGGKRHAVTSPPSFLPSFLPSKGHFSWEASRASGRTDGRTDKHSRLAAEHLIQSAKQKHLLLNQPYSVLVSVAAV